MTPNDVHDDTRSEYGRFSALGGVDVGSRTITLFPGEILIYEARGRSGFTLLRIINHDRYYKLLPSWSRFRSRPELDAIYEEYWRGIDTAYMEHAVGWPMLAMRSRSIVFADSTGIRHIPTEFLGAPYQRKKFVSFNEEIPLRPICTGFGINTALYALGIWLLFAVPNVFRRWRRVRRGLCSRCKYPIGISDTCTECGRPMKRKIVTQKAESA